MRILIIYICIVASQLKWNLFYNISLVSWVMPRYIKQLRDCWTGEGIGKEKKESGRPFLLAYGGCWKERKMMFESKYESMHTMKI
uniref:Putative ovule protein n=1 Tax=Solanum chacoense TaxID=4108 RepID=A0A0V0HM57_SOLCH